MGTVLLAAVADVVLVLIAVVVWRRFGHRIRQRLP